MEPPLRVVTVAPERLARIVPASMTIECRNFSCRTPLRAECRPGRPIYRWRQSSEVVSYVETAYAVHIFARLPVGRRYFSTHWRDACKIVLTNSTTNNPPQVARRDQDRLEARSSKTQRYERAYETKTRSPRKPKWPSRSLCADGMVKPGVETHRIEPARQ